MEMHNSSYEQNPTLLGGSEDELEGSRFDVLREIMEELNVGSHMVIKKLVKKLVKKAKENNFNVGEYVMEWLDEVASFLRKRSSPEEEETVDQTAREASEMEFNTKLERFKIKTLDVVADVKEQPKK